MSTPTILVRQIHLAAAAAAIAGVALVLIAIAAYREPDEAPWPPVGTLLRSDLLGCYELYDRTASLLDSSYYNASARVRLDSTQVISPYNPEGAYRRMLAVPAPSGDGASSMPRGDWLRWWSDAGTDSVRLSFSTGFSGAALVLSAPSGAGDTLKGRIVEQWDFGPPFTTSRGAGYAVRVPCESGS
jgi:hypothetical protein